MNAGVIALAGFAVVGAVGGWLVARADSGYEKWDRVLIGIIVGLVIGSWLVFGPAPDFCYTRAGACG